MNYEFPYSRRLQVLALVSALILHTGLAAWAMQPSDPVVMPEQQVIRIAMVTPSNPVEMEPVVEQKPEPVVPPKENGLKTVKKEPQKTVEKKEEVKKQEPKPASQQTVGRQAVDAVEKKAAVTEPLFNVSYLNNPVPEYPNAARRKGLEGKVLLDVLVTTEGTVKAIAIDHSSGHSLLDKEALEKVRNWRFVPARRGSQIVEARVSVPVEFKLN